MSTLDQGLGTLGATRPVVPSGILFAGVVIALTLVRLVGQHFSAVDIGVDEAQYWGWSRELAFGYFSKPPLIAWLNASSNFLCGDSIACIRAPAPIIYAATGVVVYTIARELYGTTVAFWAGLTLVTAPAVAFSSRIMSTDVPLLFFWALAVLAYVKLIRGGDWRWTAVLAGAFGLGLLAKYAMAYFVLGVLVAALTSADAQALLVSRRLWLGLVAGLVIFAPNLLWNIEHGLATARVTAEYVATGGAQFHIATAAAFLASQFAVLGPVTFAALLVLFVRSAAGEIGAGDRLLLAFAVPPVLLVTLGGMYSGLAYANWAAVAVVGAVVVTSAALVRGGWWRTLAAGVAIGLLAQIVLLVSDPIADRVTVAWLGRAADPYRRTMGWSELGVRAGELANASGAAAIAAEGRREVSTLRYYRRNDPRPLFIWASHRRPINHFELTRSLGPAAPEPILFLATCTDIARLQRDFATVTDLGAFTIPSGPTSERRYRAFLLAGRRGSLEPLAPCN